MQVTACCFHRAMICVLILAGAILACGDRTINSSANDGGIFDDAVSPGAADGSTVDVGFPDGATDAGTTGGIAGYLYVTVYALTGGDADAGAVDAGVTVAGFIPLTGVAVACAGLPAATTNDFGYYETGAVPAGKYECTAARDGYATFLFDVDVVPGKTSVATAEGGGLGPAPLATGMVKVDTSFPDSETADELTEAKIVVDSATMDVVTAGTLVLPVGQHLISAKLDMFVADNVTVTVMEGETTEARVTLAPAELAGYSGQQGKIDPSPAVLSIWYEEVMNPDIDAAIAQALADGALKGHATVPDVMAAALSSDARTLSWKTSTVCSGPKKVLKDLDADKHVGAWCWDPEDQESSESLKTCEWVPQGITSSADASADGHYENHQVVLVSWYGKNKAAHKGVRISFFETPKAETDTRYKNVLLATPFIAGDGRLSLKKVPLHAGGIAWYGNLLYVAGTDNGFSIFDMRRIYRVHETSEADVVGRSPDDGLIYGGDYDFVMLEVARTFQKNHGCNKSPSQVTDGLCFSSVSLDRSSDPPALITSEYRYKADMEAADVGMRIVRWNLETGSDDLEMDANGMIASDRVFLTPTKNVQGAFMKGDDFFLSTTYHDGTFYYEHDGDGKNPVANDWVEGGEDLSYWPSEDRLWSVSERTGKRMVFWVYAYEMK